MHVVKGGRVTTYKQLLKRVVGELVGPGPARGMPGFAIWSGTREGGLSGGGAKRVGIQRERGGEQQALHTQLLVPAAPAACCGVVLMCWATECCQYSNLGQPHNCALNPTFVLCCVPHPCVCCPLCIVHVNIPVRHTLLLLLLFLLLLRRTRPTATLPSHTVLCMCGVIHALHGTGWHYTAEGVDSCRCCQVMAAVPSSAG